MKVNVQVQFVAESLECFETAINLILGNLNPDMLIDIQYQAPVDGRDYCSALIVYKEIS